MQGINTEMVYITPEVLNELGIALEYMRRNNLKVGGALTSTEPRKAEYINDAIEWLIEQALMDGAYSD